MHVSEHLSSLLVVKSIHPVGNFQRDISTKEEENACRSIFLLNCFLKTWSVVGASPQELPPYALAQVQLKAPAQQTPRAFDSDRRWSSFWMRAAHSGAIAPRQRLRGFL